MPLGILEPSSQGTQVPGTQTLEDRQAQQALKHVPQPSNSPKDPLNWPLPRKNFILGILCVHSLLAAVLNTILATTTFQLVAAFKVSFTKIAMLTGFNVLALAIASLFWSATCRIYGRRHTFLFGSVLMVVGNFWASQANTYHSMLGARILQGIGIAPYEGLVQVVVADLYFVSQRGRAFAFVAVAYMMGAMITPIITGKLATDLGRRAPWYLIGGFTTALFIIVFFFFEETAFVREDITHESVIVNHKSMGDAAHVPDEESSRGSQHTTEVVQARISTFAIARLAPFSGRYSDESLIKLICRPVILCFHPAVFWGAASTGLITAWTVMLATVLAAIFAFDTPAELGYLYTGPLLGAVLSLPIAGLTSDYLTRVLAKKYGVYEPEYRLLLMVPFTIVAVIGLFGFGNTIHAAKAVPAVFFGFVISAVIFSSVAAGTYVADAYQSLGVDCFIAFLLVKNLLAFALTVKGVDWFFKVGTVKMFNTMGAAQIGVCALTIPMFFFGKTLRQWTTNSAMWQKILK